MQNRFQKSHPIVGLLYLVFVLGASMATMRIELLVLSFVLASIYGSFLVGRRLWVPTLWVFGVTLLFTAGIVPLFQHQGVTPLFYVNKQPVTLESVIFGTVTSFLLTTVFLWFQVAMKLMDEEKILYLFGRLFPQIGLLISMVFRFLPLMRKRYQVILDGQKGLGLANEQSSFMDRSKAFLARLSTLIAWSLEHSVEQSIAMEARGYGVKKRTSFHTFSFTWADGIMSVFFLSIFVSMIVFMGMGAFESNYFPEIIFSPLRMKGYVGLVVFAVGAGSPIVMDIICVRRGFRE